MFTKKKLFLAAVTAVFALFSVAIVATAQPRAIPQSIRVVVPFSPGGPVDYSARVMAEKLKQQLGVSIIVENRAGANGTVAALMVKNAPPDGATLLYTSSGMLTITPHLEKDLPYDALSDFVPVATTSYAVSGLVVGANVPASNLEEFIAVARRSSPSLTMGSAGIGNILHGYLELFKDAAGLNLLHIPYRGASLALTDVLAGQVSGMFVGLSLAAPHVDAGKLKIFGVTGTARVPLMPNVPTLEEQGVPGLDLQSWSGVMAPKNTPQPIVSFLADAISRAMNDDESKAKLSAVAITSWVVPSGGFEAAIKAESGRWEKVIREKKITMEK